MGQQMNPAEILLQASLFNSGIEAEEADQRTKTVEALRHLATQIETNPDSIKAIAVLAVEKVDGDEPGCLSHGNILGSHVALASLFIQLTPLVNECMQRAQPILNAESSVQDARSGLRLIKG